MISNSWKMFVRWVPALGICFALTSAAQWPNMPGPIYAGFVTPGLTSSSFAVDSIGGKSLSVSGGMAFASGFYAFDGTNDMLFAATNAWGAPLVSGSIVARIFLTDATNIRHRIFWSNNRAATTQYIGIQTGVDRKLQYIVRANSAESSYTVSDALSTGVYINVGFSTDGTSGQLYVDGLPVSQTTNAAGGAAGRFFSVGVSNTTICAGALQTSGGDFFGRGRTSALLVFSSRLNDAEQAAVHNILNAGGSSSP